MKKTQGLDSYSPSSSLHRRSNSGGDRTPPLSRTSSSSANKGTPATAPNQTRVISPADLYAQAISARNESLSKQQQLPVPRSPTRVVVPQYLTAEQEKAALRRYEEAKMAVDRVQNTGYAADGGGLPSDGGSGSSAIPMDTPNASHLVKDNPDLPPPFDHPTNGNVIPASHIGEKERLRREYERQDAARTRLKRQETLPPSFSESQSQSSHGGFPSQPPPHSGSSSSHTRSPSSAHTSPSIRRPTPAPPSTPSSSRIMTAAEEKAMLRARYAAEEAKGTGDVSPPYINGNGHGHHINNLNYSPPRPEPSQSPSLFLPSRSNSYSPAPEPPSSPPPLMPRPPAEYIQETQEEDARISRLAMNGVLPPDEDTVGLLSMKPAVVTPVYLPTPMSATPPLEVRPFSPFSAAFEQTPGLVLPGPPPPLPPKPAGD